MATTSKKSPFSGAVAARYTSELIAKLDELTKVLAAASPVAVQLSRSDVARGARGGQRGAARDPSTRAVKRAIRR